MTRRQTPTIAREATPERNDGKTWAERGQESEPASDPTASPKCELPAPVVDLRDAPIEGVAKLLAAISLPCDCERGAPDGVDCALPIDRWEREWAANL